MDTGKPSPRKLEPLCGKIGRGNVDLVVHEFYEKLHLHPDLKSFFRGIKDFEAHEVHVADFWWVAMGGRIGEHRPFDMVGRHLPLNLDEHAIALWLDLFNTTLHTHLPQELAEQWFLMAQEIGANMQHLVLPRN